MESLDIRRATCEEDMTRILPLRIGWIHEDRPDLYVEEAAELQQLIRRLKEGRDFFMGNIEGRSVAYCCGMDMVDIYVSEGVFVHRDFRKRGIGSALKKAQVEHAKRSHYDALVSYVMPNNAASQRMQQKVGAIITESEEFNYYPDHDAFVVYLRS